MLFRPYAYRMWYTTPLARRKAEERHKKRLARLHWHVCDFCQNETKYRCQDYHCRGKKKRACSECRRRKKYHHVEPDLFDSVVKARRHFSIMDSSTPDGLIAVHMESSYENGEIVHKYFAMWNDGSRIELTPQEVSAWAGS